MDSSSNQRGLGLAAHEAIWNRRRDHSLRVCHLWPLSQHMILTCLSANLSEEYFTSRLDRYHVFASKALTEYYAQIHHAICSLSFRVLPDSENESYLLDWPSSNGAPSPLDSPEDFVAYSSIFLNPLIQASDNKPVDPSESSQTFVYPVSQFTPLLKPKDTSTEYTAVTTILRMLSSSPAFAGARWLFTAGSSISTPSFPPS